MGTITSTPKRWTYHEEDQLAEYRGEGLCLKEIAERLGRTVASVRSRSKLLKLVPDRRWSDAEKQFAIEQRGKLTIDQIAEQLGRSRSAIYQLWDRLNLCERQQDSRPLQAFIREKHPLGWSDAEMAAAWSAEHPEYTVGREWVMELRRDKLGLPHNAYSQHRRRRVAEKTKEQLAKAGLPSIGHLRARAFQQFAARHGWPADLRPRAVQILDLLYQRGPHTRRQIFDAIGMPWKGSRKSLVSNDPEGSYLAHLAARGLIVVSQRAVRGKGRGKSVNVYAIAPHVRRGEVCPNAKTTA
jgi:hypothetical protein